MKNDLQDNKGSIVFHLDNTTIHRLQFLLDKDIRSAGEPDLEFLNILHLLESLLLADKITIATFESNSSQEISDHILGVIDVLSNSLMIDKEKSSLSNQLQIAEKTVKEIFDKKLLSFNPTEDYNLFTKVNVKAARPSGVVEINSEFWTDIFNNKGSLTHDAILDKAKAKVLDFRTDALFIYGIAIHKLFYEKIFESYSKYGVWDDDHWNKLHVLFRSYFNQNLSHNLGAIYSPPPIRAISLDNAHTKIITDIKTTIEDFPNAFLSRKNKEQFDLMTKGIQFPIPLIGIAAIPKTNKKDKNQFIDNFLKVREETSELRKIIRRLNQFDSEYSIATELNLLKESYEIKKEIANLLNLNDPTILPKKVSEVDFIRRSIDELVRFLKKENKTARFFSNLLTRINDEPNLDEVKKYLQS
jgi:hypothetical protein